MVLTRILSEIFYLLFMRIPKPVALLPRIKSAVDKALHVAHIQDCRIF